jgi:hypothetical protein
MKTVCTAIAELSFDENESLLHIRVLKDAEMNLKNTIAHYKLIGEITEGKNYLALVDATEYFSINSETLKYTSLPETIEKRIATAHYNPSFGNKLTMDFFRKKHKPDLPVNSFDTKEEAIEWLKVQWKNSKKEKKSAN